MAERKDCDVKSGKVKMLCFLCKFDEIQLKGQLRRDHAQTGDNPLQAHRSAERQRLGAAFQSH